jgi:drug/metabolite transporter (DMT)-like permease
MNANNLFGIMLVMGFVLMSAINGVFLSTFLQSANIFSTLLCVFSLIAFLFNVYITIRHGMIWRNFSRKVWFYIGLSNLTTAANWFSFFFAVKYIEPAISATLVNSVLPLATIGISLALLGKRIRGLSEILPATALFIAMLITASVVFSGQSGRPAAELHSNVIGVIMSLVCGISIALNTVVAKKLNELDIAPSTIMAYRFFLLIFIAAILVDEQILRIDLEQSYLAMLVIAIVGNLIPLFSLQLGIKRLPPVTVVFLNGLAPMSYFLVQSMTNQFHFSWASLLSIIFSTCVILTGAYYSNRAKPTKATESIFASKITQS